MIRFLGPAYFVAINRCRPQFRPLAHTTMTRAEIHQLFVAEFHQGKPAAPFASSDIQRIESELATVLPRSYTTFIETHGSIHTPSLLSLIVDGGHEQWDVMNFFDAAAVVNDTKNSWSAGMSEQLVGFASDSMGNFFCFRRVALGTSRADDAEIWFFDHEFCNDSKIADGFDEWLLSYIKLNREDMTT